MDTSNDFYLLLDFRFCHGVTLSNQLTMNSFTRIAQNGSCAMERIDYYTYQGISGLPCGNELNSSFNTGYTSSSFQVNNYMH